MTSSNKNKPGTPFPPDAKTYIETPPTPTHQVLSKEMTKINNEKNIGRKTTKK